MKIKPPHEINVNVAATDPLLNERLKLYSRRSRLRFTFSQIPLLGEVFDAYLLPAEALDLPETALALQSGKLLLAYGPSGLLRKAFLAGCADYLKEPWEPEELEYRLFKEVQEEAGCLPLPWGELTLQALKIRGPGGEQPLSFQEYRILQTLLRNRGQIVPREVLYYSIWGKPAGGPSRVVDVHISRLRKKILSLLPGLAECIVAVRGVGYLIE